jgi:hypothetical protein
MSDGDILKKMITGAGKREIDLRVAAGLSRARVYQLFKEERFSPNVRALVLEALRKLRIDPTGLGTPTDPGEITDPDKLRQLLDGIPVEALEQVKRIMEATRGERLALGAIINERLSRRR